MSDGGFTEFVHSRWASLVRLAYPVTLDMQRAEDIAQEALVKLWFAWQKVRDENPDGYVRTVLVRLALSSRRRRWHGERPTDLLPEQAASTQFADETDRRLDIIALLAQLSPRQRAVVVLRFLEDLSEHEVAALLGCSPGSVKQHTSRALAKLRASTERSHLAEVVVQTDGGPE